MRCYLTARRTTAFYLQVLEVCIRHDSSTPTKNLRLKVKSSALEHNERSHMGSEPNTLWSRCCCQGRARCRIRRDSLCLPQRRGCSAVLICASNMLNGVSCACLSCLFPRSRQGKRQTTVHTTSYSCSTATVSQTPVLRRWADSLLFEVSELII